MPATCQQPGAEWQAAKCSVTPSFRILHMKGTQTILMTKACSVSLLLKGKSRIPFLSPRPYFRAHQWQRHDANPLGIWETRHQFLKWDTDNIFICCAYSTLFWKGFKASRGHQLLKNKPYCLLWVCEYST